MVKEKLPNSQSGLIFGILSIFTACCCGGVIGLIFGFIGLSKSNKAIAIHSENPDMYDGINNANTGRITSIIGLIIGAISTIWLIYLLSTGQYEMMIEQYQQGIEDFM
ncbi:MAG: DUF4190 domain-containing protein [Flavobacteriaceae bacterium]|nr:DUF4190 domain-containing protein [Flavobacteriaceae bacterium]